MALMDVSTWRPAAPTGLYARGSTPRPPVGVRALGIDPGGAWTGMCLVDPPLTVLQAFTVSRYAVDGYHPGRDFNPRNARQWTALRGHTDHLAYDKLYVARVRDRLKRLADAYGPFAVVLEGINPAVMALHPGPAKAEVVRQTALVYGAVLGIAPAAVVVAAGDHRGQWGQPAHGGHGVAAHYPRSLRGKPKVGHWANDVTAVKASFPDWSVPDPYAHPREAFDHLTEAVWTGQLKGRA